MQLKDTKDGCQYFLFEHSQQYQKVQFEFYDAVESLNPQNIGVRLWYYSSYMIYFVCILFILAKVC
jgi:hypothetical protein